jgi:hypothetical protein
MWPFSTPEQRDAEITENLSRLLGSADGQHAICAALTSENRKVIAQEFEAKLVGLADAIVSRSVAEINQSLNRAKDSLGLFLHSEQGKRILSDRVIDGFARAEFGPIAETAGMRLKNLAAEEIASLMADAQMAVERSVAEQAVMLKRRAGEVAAEMVAQSTCDVDRHLGSYRGLIAEAVEQQLPPLLQEEVVRHLNSGPLLSQPPSNRELALAYGISIREVKRRRRYGDFR